MFAIIKVGNTQYKVSPKDVILVDKIEGNVGDTINVSDVLLVSDGKKTQVGTPLVKGATVSVKILAQEQDEKIAVRRYKQKVRYRRHIGFRAKLTRLEVISVDHA